MFAHSPGFLGPGATGRASALPARAARGRGRGEDVVGARGRPSTGLVAGGESGTYPSIHEMLSPSGRSATAQRGAGSAGGGA